MRIVSLLIIVLVSAFAIGCEKPVEDGGKKGKAVTPEVKVEKKEAPKEKAAPKVEKKKEEPTSQAVSQAASGYAPKVDGWGELITPASAKAKAPAKFKAKLVTTKGDIVLEVNRDWSPNGADRFYNLVKSGYFQDTAIFRAIPNFMFQFGIHGNPEMNKIWKDANIKDDKVKESNKPMYITMAKTGMPNSRSVQFFINLRDNKGLDGQGFSPFGKVVKGMDIVKAIQTTGENSGEVQSNFQAKGNAFISKRYPKIDYIKSAELLK